MRQLVETIVRGLVDDQDAVEVEERGDARSVTYDVRVAEDDRGHIIGRNGATASAIRTLVSGVAKRKGLRIDIHILD